MGCCRQVALLLYLLACPSRLHLPTCPLCPLPPARLPWPPSAPPPHVQERIISDQESAVHAFHHHLKRTGPRGRGGHGAGIIWLLILLHFAFIAYWGAPSGGRGCGGGAPNSQGSQVWSSADGRAGRDGVRMRASRRLLPSLCACRGALFLASQPGSCLGSSLLNRSA